MTNLIITNYIIDKNIVIRLQIHIYILNNLKYQIKQCFNYF